MSDQYEPVLAVAEDGLVHIVAEPGMAKAIADALEFTFASGGLEENYRPLYLLDCNAIWQAVIKATLQAEQELAGTRFVPVAPVSHLRLVPGGGR